jgi:hypothetical protein
VSLPVCKADGEIYRTELFMSQHLKVNMPNKNGYTAVSLTVNRRHRTYVELMLKHPLYHRLYLHYKPEINCNTVVSRLTASCTGTSNGKSGFI